MGNSESRSENVPATMQAANALPPPPAPLMVPPQSVEPPPGINTADHDPRPGPEAYDHWKYCGTPFWGMRAAVSEGSVLRVEHLHPNGPAERAGLCVGDHITHLNGEATGNSHDTLLRLMMSIEQNPKQDKKANIGGIGEPVEVRVRRGGSNFDVLVYPMTTKRENCEWQGARDPPAPPPFYTSDPADGRAAEAEAVHLQRFYDTSPKIEQHQTASQGKATTYQKEISAEASFNTDFGTNFGVIGTVPRYSSIIAAGGNFDNGFSPPYYYCSDIHHHRPYYYYPLGVINNYYVQNQHDTLRPRHIRNGSRNVPTAPQRSPLLPPGAGSHLINNQYYHPRFTHLAPRHRHAYTRGHQRSASSLSFL